MMIVHFASMHSTYWLIRVEVYRYMIPASLGLMFPAHSYGEFAVACASRLAD
jgi:hypothetical protein